MGLFGDYLDESEKDYHSMEEDYVNPYKESDNDESIR